MWNRRVGRSILPLALVALIGCGDGKKPDGAGSTPAPGPGVVKADKPKENAPKPKAPKDGTGKQPDGGKGKDKPPEPLGEAKFKLKFDEFVEDFTKSGSAKYVGQVVELTGNVTRAAGPEIEGFGTVVSGPKGYKVAFAFGAPNAKIADTVLVRDLSASAVGSVLRGQEAVVKGRVARHVPPNAIELIDSELLSPGADVSVKLGADVPRARMEFGTTIIEGVVASSVDGYLEVKVGNTVCRCYLMPGIDALFPSGLSKDAAVRLAGTYRNERIETTDLNGKFGVVFHDCVPLHAKPSPK